MKKNKFFKYLKYALIVWVSFTILVCVGAIIKYNLDLNEYINQEVPLTQTQKNSIENKGTEVYVVGSMHFETNDFKRDDIYNYINQVSPAIILYESDKSTVNRMVNRTDFWRQFRGSFSNKNPVEKFVALRYLKYHPEAKVLGFEWEERDNFHFKHSYQKNSSELLRKARKLEKDNLLSNKESRIMNDYFAVNNKYYNLGNSTTIYDINNPIADSIIKKRQEFVYNKIPKILSTKELSEDLKKFVPIHMKYWGTRNMAMVKNIVNQIKNNPNQRIVVLTGYSHRYYLIDELKKLEEEYGFSIKPI